MADFTPTVILDEPIILGTSTGTQEVQKVAFSAQESGKTSTLELDGEKTSAIAAKASVTATEVKEKLEALSNVGPVGSGQTYELVSVTLATEVATITFAGKSGNVPTLVTTSTGSPAPTVTTVTQGLKPSEAVTKGIGNADATTRVQPRNEKTPKKIREEHSAEYGDS